MKPTVVVLGSFLASEYLPRWQRQQEFTACFMREANVLYVERAAPGAITPKRVVSRMRKMLARRHPSDAALPDPPAFVKWVQLPSSSEAGWRKNGAAVARAVTKAAADRGWTPPSLAVCGIPTEVWRYALEDLAIPFWYDVWERILESRIYTTTDRGHMRWLAERATLMTTDTEVGRDDWLDVRSDIVVVPHGAKEWARPPDFGVPRDRLWYVGGANLNLDSELLGHIARRAGGLSLVGGAQEHERQDGVEVIGWRPAGEIPFVLSSAYAGVIPYRVDRFGAGTYPTKVYDYLLAGAPVVATKLPSLAGHPYVRTFGSDVELDEALEWARSQDIDARKAMRQWALDNGWSKRYAVVRAELARRGVDLPGGV